MVKQNNTFEQSLTKKKWDIADVQAPDNIVDNQLYTDVCVLIENARQMVATTVNAEVCIMNWQIGKRIKEDVLFNQRAEYGKQVVKQLAEKLTDRYGKGWSDRKLLHCVRSAYTFSEEEIVSAVRIQFTWTHLRSIIDLKLGKFKPEYEGQMLLYLRYLNKNERRAGEESPIGLILCSEGNTEQNKIIIHN
ncbi:hypothetical protein AGMMS49965_21210 [Bacteroidia bacterium]|nr:hypothetical protein AGMMS49965_21210 [Bacteroidia bacterium]